MFCFITQPKEGQKSVKTHKIKNFQRTELYRSLTTKKLKKKYLSKLVGRAETDSLGGEDMQNVGGKWTGQIKQWLETKWSYICERINQEQQLGSKTDHETQGSSLGRQSLKTSGCKILWGLRQWKKLPDSQKSPLERPTES